MDDGGGVACLVQLSAALHRWGPFMAHVLAGLPADMLEQQCWSVVGSVASQAIRVHAACAGVMSGAAQLLQLVGCLMVLSESDACAACWRACVRSEVV